MNSLREWRMHAGLTMRELGRLAHVNATTILRIERDGQRPFYWTRQALATALGKHLHQRMRPEDIDWAKRANVEDEADTKAEDVRHDPHESEDGGMVASE